MKYVYDLKLKKKKCFSLMIIHACGMKVRFRFIYQLFKSTNSFHIPFQFHLNLNLSFNRTHYIH